MATDPSVSDSYVSTSQQASNAQSATPLTEPTQVVVPASETIPQVQVDANTTTDPGADPYVSNGQSTIAQPEQQQQAEDPFAQQPQEESPSPTEQDVIAASDEPYLSASQQSALENQQADNRALLRKEEGLAPLPASKAVKITSAKDWRVRMSISPTLDALYNSASGDDILAPLKATNGVIFPYTPTIQTGYKATYEVSELVHTNYKNYFYKNSSVDDLTITADFTAQDQQEAQYLLAVMHFFRSVTKMFYGQDKSPNAGTPPPLVFLSGFGAYQYDNHPLLISSFSYTLPNEVDYIRTTSTGKYLSNTPGANAGNNSLTGMATTASKFGLTGISNMLSGVNRLMGAGLKKGGLVESTGTIKSITSRATTTYVPTKIQFSISAYPIVTRRDISQNFSLEKYAKGTIYSGSRQGGNGIW